MTLRANKHHLVFGSILVLAVSAAGDCVTVRTSDGQGADAYIGNYAPDGNFGGHPFVMVKNAAQSLYRKGYFRFDLRELEQKPLSIAAFRPMVSSHIEGAPVFGPQVFHVWGLRDVAQGVVDDADPAEGGWIEGDGTEGAPAATGIAWATAPANDQSSGFLLTSDAELLGEFVLLGNSTPGTEVFFASESLDAMLLEDTNGLITLMVTRVTEDPNQGGFIHTFWADEGSGVDGEPRLVLTVPSSADLNGDLIVDAADLALLLGSWGACPRDCAADMDQDGAVGGSDLSILLGAWGPPECSL